MKTMILIVLCAVFALVAGFVFLGCGQLDDRTQDETITGENLVIAQDPGHAVCQFGLNAGGPYTSDCDWESIYQSNSGPCTVLGAGSAGIVQIFSGHGQTGYCTQLYGDAFDGEWGARWTNADVQWRGWNANPYFSDFGAHNRIRSIRFAGVPAGTLGVGTVVKACPANFSTTSLDPNTPCDGATWPDGTVSALISLIGSPTGGRAEFANDPGSISVAWVTAPPPACPYRSNSALAVPRHCITCNKFDTSGQRVVVCDDGFTPPSYIAGPGVPSGADCTCVGTNLTGPLSSGELGTCHYGPSCP